MYIDSCDVTPEGDDPSRGTARSSRADIASAAVAMVRVQPGGGATLDTEAARRTELARQGLTSGQHAIAEQDLVAMEYGKFAYPMLGLYAMHLLRDRPTIDWKRIATIAGNLDRLLNGGHPDVRVFVDVCKANGQTVNECVSPRPMRLWPPVLALTWDLADNAMMSALDREQDELLRQYRMGGSIWSCLLVPKQGILIAAAPSGATPPQRKGYVAKVAELLAPAAAPTPSLDDWKNVVDGLRRPNPNYTPFQQALRRRVLDLTTADPDLRDDLDKQFDFQKLVEQFHLSQSLALQSYKSLHDDATATLKSRRRSPQGSRGGWLEVNVNLKEIVSEAISQELPLSSKDFSLDTPLEELEIDSLTAIAILYDLEDRLGVEIPNEVFNPLTNVGDIVKQLQQIIDSSGGAYLNEK